MIIASVANKTWEIISRSHFGSSHPLRFICMCHICNYGSILSMIQKLAAGSPFINLHVAETTGFLGVTTVREEIGSNFGSDSDLLDDRRIRVRVPVETIFLFSTLIRQVLELKFLQTLQKFYTLLVCTTSMKHAQTLWLLDPRNYAFPSFLIYAWGATHLCGLRWRRARQLQVQGKVKLSLGLIN
jgi:hypothetical protein